MGASQVSVIGERMILEPKVLDSGDNGQIAVDGTGVSHQRSLANLPDTGRTSRDVRGGRDLTHGAAPPTVKLPCTTPVLATLMPPPDCITAPDCSAGCSATGSRKPSSFSRCTSSTANAAALRAAAG